jgi:ABC-type transport system involved in multi-copper enzyme maturation permease subunit
MLPGWLQTPLVPVAVAKEIRALCPAWLATWALPVVLLAAYGYEGWVMAAWAYGVGCAVLGASVVGHEFGHRTMPLLLVQPVPRPRLWRLKLATLAGALLTAAVVVGVLLSGNARIPQIERWWLGPIADWLVPGAVLLPPLLAWCTAPWLTLLARNTLAGAVFSLTLPLLVWSMAGLITLLRFGAAQLRFDEAEQFRLFCCLAMLVVYAVLGGVWGYRRFRRLEALDDRGGPVSFPAGFGSWVGRVWPTWAAGRRAPGARLVSKELRLQQVSFLVAGLLVLAWLLYALLWHLEPEPNSAFVILWSTVLLGMPPLLLPLLIGASACAEERQLGTLEWHLTLPVSTRRQWCIKAATAFVLALVLASGLPAGLAYLFNLTTNDPADAPWLIAPVLLTAVGLYASSVSQSGVKAMLFGAASAAILGSLVAGVGSLSYGKLAEFDWLAQGLLGALGLTRGAATRLAEVLVTGGFVVGSALLLVLAYYNYRRTAHDVRWFWRQALLLGGVTVLWTHWTSCVFRYSGSAPEAESVTSALEPLTPTPGSRPGQMDALEVQVKARHGIVTGPDPADTNLMRRTMSLEMMRRYGLLPRIPTPTNQAQPSPASTNTAKPSPAPVPR